MSCKIDLANGFKGGNLGGNQRCRIAIFSLLIKVFGIELFNK